MRLALPRLVLPLLLVAALPAAASAPEPPALLARVAVVGASVSAGFGNGLPLATLLDAAIRAEHAPVLNACAGVQNPAWFGETQIQRCLAHEPTLVVGVDYLFWHTHRTAARGEDELELRREALRGGLEQLEKLDCPLVVGDIPDMSGADPKRLVPLLVPSPPVRDALNDEIRAWAAGREDVLLVPLSEWVATLTEGEWTIPASPDGAHPARVLTAGEALLDDGLHPRRIGAVLLADRLLTAMRARFDELDPAVDYDVWRVLERLGALEPRAAEEAPDEREEG